MAVGTAIASGVIGLVKVGVAMDKSAKLKDSIRNFKRQDLINPYKTSTVSTLKSEQQTYANNVNFATSINALQRGGSKMLLGGLPTVNNSNIELQNAISIDLEQQDIRNKNLIAVGEEKIRSIRENRESNALLGLGQELTNSRQLMSSGITDVVSSGLAFDSLYGDKKVDDSYSNLFKQDVPVFKFEMPQSSNSKFF